MNTPREWEEEFDERFKDSQCNCVLDGHKKNERCPSRTTYYNFTPEEIKSFIRTVEDKAREEERERVLHEIGKNLQIVEIIKPNDGAGLLVRLNHDLLDGTEDVRVVDEKVIRALRSDITALNEKV